MQPNAQANTAPALLVCPICRGPLSSRKGEGTRCSGCAVGYASAEGVMLLGPPFEATGVAEASEEGPFADRMRELAGDAAREGWEVALERFTEDVLSGRLPAPTRSRWDRVRAKVTGSTWEDTLQGVVDPTGAAWKFLLDIRQDSRVCFLGPSLGAAAISLGRSCREVVVLDGATWRLDLTRQQADGAGLGNLTFGRVTDPVELPIADGTVDLAIVPDLIGWFEAIGAQSIPPNGGASLLSELRRILRPGGQAYIGTDNRWGVSWLLNPRRVVGASFSRATMRRAASSVGFAGVEMFAPLPFRHKFHQILDVQRTDRMNFCADPYRTRGKVLRPLVKVWDRTNREAAVERRLYPWVPGLSAVLTTDTSSRCFAERLLAQVADVSDVPPSARRLTRYYVRAKGAVVLAGGDPSNGGIFVRLPLSESAAASCARQHRAAETLTADERMPHSVRRLFPTPLAQGDFEGQTFFAEKALVGESGRLYYSRPERRFDRAIVNAAEVLRQIRRSTEVATKIGEAEFNEFCGAFLRELHDIVNEDARDALDRVERTLREILIGATLPLGWHHGDYDFANLLYGPDDRVTGILDFEVYDPKGLPLLDFLVLLARRPIRRQGYAFGTLFVRVLLERKLPPLETEILEREMKTLGIDERLYRALALCCWLNHLKLRRDSWLVRSSSWLDENLHTVIESVRRVL